MGSRGVLLGSGVGSRSIEFGLSKASSSIGMRVGTTASRSGVVEKRRMSRVVRRTHSVGTTALPPPLTPSSSHRPSLFAYTNRAPAGPLNRMQNVWIFFRNVMSKKVPATVVACAAVVAAAVQGFVAERRVGCGLVRCHSSSATIFTLN